MKTRFFVVVLMVAVVGFAACSGNKEKDPPPVKSDNNNVKEFAVKGVKYEVKANEIVYIYPKSDANQWSTLPTGVQDATVTLEDSKAKTNPLTVQVDFAKVGAAGTAATVCTFKVISESGKEKEYTVKVTKSAELK